LTAAQASGIAIDMKASTRRSAFLVAGGVMLALSITHLAGQPIAHMDTSTAISTIAGALAIPVVLIAVGLRQR
jgi:hypothetical protein